MDVTGAVIQVVGNSILAVVTAGLVFFRVYRAPGTGLIAGLVGGGLFAAAEVVLLLSILGYTGLLTPAAITLGHVALFLVATLTCCDGWAEAGRWTGTQVGRLRAAWSGISQWERLAVVVTLGLVALLILTALFSFSAVHDSHCYRLTRIAYWLQEQSLRPFTTFDERMNYSAIDGDLLMLWLTGPFPRGYPLTALAQSFGGLLLAAATLGLARRLGLGKAGCWAVVLLLLGMPVFTLQMMTDQVDLLAAGFLAAGMYFALVSLERGRFVLPAWLGIALAIGTKGTVFYWWAGLIVLALGWIALCRPPWRLLGRHALVGAACLALFALPRHLENQARSGNPFGPAHDQALLHRGPGAGSWVGKMTLNNATYAAQLLDPVSNPGLLRPLLRPAALALAKHFPARKDADSLNWGRGEFLRLRAAMPPDMQQLPSALEMAGPGIIVAVLFLVGIVVARLSWARRRDRAAAFLLVGAVAVIGFFLVYGALYVWMPYAFRFFLLTAPWAVLVGAYAVEKLPGRARGVALLVLAVFSVQSFAAAWSEWPGVGYANLFERAKDPFYRSLLVARQTIGDFVPPGGTALVSLPRDDLSAPLFRTGHRVRLHLLGPNSGIGAAKVGLFLVGSPAGADALIGAGSELDGQLQGVAAGSYAIAQNQPDRYRWTAYRLARPGEPALPFVSEVRASLDYPTNRYRETWLVRNLTGPELHFRLANSARFLRKVRVETPAGIVDQWLGPGQRATVTVPCPDGDAASIHFLVAPALPAEALQDNALLIRLLQRDLEFHIESPDLRPLWILPLPGRVDPRLLAGIGVERLQSEQPPHGRDGARPSGTTGTP